MKWENIWSFREGVCFLQQHSPHTALAAANYCSWEEGRHVRDVVSQILVINICSREKHLPFFAVADTTPYTVAKKVVSNNANNWSSEWGAKVKCGHSFRSYSLASSSILGLSSYSSQLVLPLCGGTTKMLLRACRDCLTLITWSQKKPKNNNI